MKKLRWGLLGAGKIVDRWINGMMQCENSVITAVSSRSPETAKSMAEKYNIPKVMTYDEMISCDDVDICYIPVPHPFHKDLAIKAMNSGKAVLVEKPMGISTDEVKEMVACAKKNNVFFMEAMWTRFFPILEEVKAKLPGEIRMIESAFGFRTPASEAKSRLLDPAQAGGGLLDVGVYPLTMADIFLGEEPLDMKSFLAINTDENQFGVDEQGVVTAMYKGGAIAISRFAVRTDMVDTAVISCTDGRIEIPHFWKPTEFTVYKDGKSETFTHPVELINKEMPDEGFSYEIKHTEECIAKGLIESPVMTWDLSIRLMSQCDEIAGK